MTGGLIAAAGALIVATAFGLYWRARNGRIVAQPQAMARNASTASSVRPPDAAATVTANSGRAAAAPATASQAAASPTRATPAQAGPAPAGPAPASQAPASQAAASLASPVPGEQARDGLGQDDLGTALGSRATLVQFSSAFCAPCRATRRILTDVAGMTDGVTHVEIDAESRLDLVRRLDVRRTPTTFVLGPDGRVTHRASGQPRKADVIAALGAVL